MSPPLPALAPSIVFGSHTDVGQRREHNEDALRCEILGLGAFLVVCDGVGGAKAGEVASKIAVDGMQSLIAERLAREPAPADRRPWLDAAARKVDGLVRAAAEQPGRSGMGATLSALWLDGGQAWWAQVGDSRIYLLRGGELRQVSRDQSPVGRLRAEGQLSEEDARHHPCRHMIDQCLGGSSSAVEPETGELPIFPGDLFLLCSDGLCDGLRDHDIAVGLNPAAQGLPPVETARQLVARANELSGNDNITAVVARVQRDSTASPAPTRAAVVFVRELLRRFAVTPSRAVPP